MIARRTCHEEQMDLELKQLHCHMEEEVCDKNNMKPGKRSGILEEVRKPQREISIVRRWHR